MQKIIGLPKINYSFIIIIINVDIIILNSWEHLGMFSKHFQATIKLKYNLIPSHDITKNYFSEIITQTQKMLNTSLTLVLVF